MTKTPAKRKSLAIALLAMMSATAACGSGGASNSAKPDGVISYAHSVGPSTLDPARVKTAHEILYLNPIYDRLVYLDPVSGEAGPMLASDWTIKEDERGGWVDFTLRRGLEFPDGAPFGAQTVKANIERSQSLKGTGVAKELAQIAEVEVLAPDKVRVRSKAGAGWIPNVLAAGPG